MSGEPVLPPWGTMRHRFRLIVTVVALVATAGVVASARQQPDVETLLKATQAYAEKYLDTVSGVSLDETLILLDTSGAMRRTPERISADLILVHFADGLLGLRDLYAVDTRKLRERTPRVVDALQKPTQENVDRAQKYVREHAAHLMHNLVVWYTDPVLGVQYALPANAKKLTYSIDGEKKINGVRTIGLGFKETEAGPHVLEHIPGNAVSRGRLWVDPETGAIHTTELWVQSQTDIVRVTVNFAPDKNLNWILPTKSSFNLEWREYGNRFNSTVGGSQEKLSFEGNAEYGKAVYTKIDLSGR